MPNPDSINYGSITPRNLKRCRKAHGWTQEQFGKIIGVRQATIADWENGKVSPSYLARLRIIELGFNGP